jgi:phenylacetate-CoA ligase
MAYFARSIVFPLQEAIKGKSTLRMLKDLERSEWLTPGKVLDLQLQNLRRHLEYAYSTVPYYRTLWHEYGIRPSQIKDLKDFQKLPFLTRDILRQHFDRLRSNSVTRRVQKISTGGSTGSPVTVLVDPERTGFVDAVRMRAHRWFDADVGVKEIVLWGSPIETSKQDYVRCLRDRFLNSRLLSAFKMGDADLTRYCELISSYRPVKIYGYASAIFLLAKFWEKLNRKPPVGLKVIFTTAEPLFDFQRQLIQEVFGVKVAVEYGARDAGLMANECPEGSLHVPAEGMVVEIINANSDGLGEIAVTNLHSKAMPIIRYRTGDMGVLEESPCSCGRGLPRLKQIDGRQTDFLIATDGRVVHALAVIYILRDMSGIKEFQVVQQALRHIIIRVVPEHALTADDHLLIIKNVRRLLGAEVEVDVETVSQIPPLPSGKFRYVVSHVAERTIADMTAAGGE